MDFHEIEAFLSLAETLHFARAAAQIHLSPSALSRLLGRLEEEVGVTLFERDTRRVSLTEDGETFLQFARDLNHKKADLFMQIGKKDDSLRGIYRIYASVTACYSILPPFAEALTTAHPGLRISVETGDPAYAADAVREGRADLALGALPDGGFKDLSCFSVRKTPLVFVSSAKGAYGSLSLPLVGSQNLEAQWLATNKQCIDILKRTPLVLPKHGLARERFDRWTRMHNIKPEIAAETAGNEALLAFARLGLGLALVPLLVLENGPFAEGLVLYQAGSEFGEYNIGFMQKSEQSGSTSTKKLRVAIADIIERTYPVQKLSQTEI